MEFPAAEELRIPYEISFDGCAYDLSNANGDPLYKPWTIQTNEEELFEPLSVSKTSEARSVQR